MRRLLPLSALLCLSCAAATPSAVLDARKSAVQIVQRERGEDGRWTYRAVCSGAVVGLERGPRIVSAGHCVSEAPNARYHALDHAGRLWGLRLEEWENAWPKADYAVFRSVATVALPPLTAASTCEVGQNVWTWAGPLGLGLMLFRGEMAGTLSTPYDPEGEALVGGMAYSTLPVMQGASGGLVLNERGEATAIVVGIFQGMSGAFLAPLPD